MLGISHSFILSRSGGGFRGLAPCQLPPLASPCPQRFASELAKHCDAGVASKRGTKLGAGSNSLVEHTEHTECKTLIIHAGWVALLL